MGDYNQDLQSDTIVPVTTNGSVLRNVFRQRDAHHCQHVHRRQGAGLHADDSFDGPRSK